MKEVKRLSWKQFEKKHKGRLHVTCNVHFESGEGFLFQNSSFSQIESFVRGFNSEVSFIAC